VNDEQLNRQAKLLGAKELAAELGVSTRTIHAWTRNESLPAPFLIHARRSYWTRIQIETWLEASKIVNVKSSRIG
jgi:predicted DNA-binding transcriptional regulator AlpA